MTALHFLYGLRLASNRVLPGVPLQHNLETTDVRLQLEDKWHFPITHPATAEDQYGVSEGGPDDQSNLRVGLFPDGRYFGLLYRDGVKFAVERRGSEVWADWPENYTLEDACTYLVGPVMGFVLRLRGTVCLHASAVAIGDCAIALIGSPGAGKSTTAAAFACSGFPVLSDDVVALTDKGAQFLVQPGYPRLNLWPDSVQRLFGSGDALPRITPTWDKRYLPLGKNGHHFASTPLPLGAIYILDRRDETLAAPVIGEVLCKDAFMALVANTYVNYLLDKNMRRTEFDVLSRLVSQVPIRKVCVPTERSTIFSLCEGIAADAKRVMVSIAANATPVLG